MIGDNRYIEKFKCIENLRGFLTPQNECVILDTIL